MGVACKRMKWSRSIFLWTIAMTTTSLTFVAVIVWYRRLRAIPGVNKQIRNGHQLLDITNYSIKLIENEEACEMYLQERYHQPINFVGLDCEWVSRKGCLSHHVALLQLAFTDKTCALIRLYKFTSLPLNLVELLQDRSILKYGVGISNDAKRLKQAFGVETFGCIDLRHLALRCGIRRNAGLAGLTNQLLGRDLAKSQETTCSNWEVDVLSEKQVEYAAADAIAGLLILRTLVSRKMSGVYQHWDHNELSSTENIDDHYTFKILTSDDGIACTRSLCQGIIDINFRNHSHSNVSTIQHGIDGATSQGYSLRKTPLYHNCQLLAPDGTKLSNVDIKKIEWYLNKGLGVLESQDPPILRLNFEPAGKPGEDRQYYLEEKQNICVVCGKRDGYIRKNVVPHEYRKHFPSHVKSHMSHDVLLLCTRCHQTSSQLDAHMRQQLAYQYNAPISQKFHEDKEVVRYRSLAKALLGDRGQQLPKKRRAEIMHILAEHFNCEEASITEEMIIELASTETRSLVEEYRPHGEIVVEAIRKEGKLLEFQRNWRQHFVTTMNPRHLPSLWSIDHNPVKYY